MTSFLGKKEGREGKGGEDRRGRGGGQLCYSGRSHIMGHYGIDQHVRRGGEVDSVFGKNKEMLYSVLIWPEILHIYANIHCP